MSFERFFVKRLEETRAEENNWLERWILVSSISFSLPFIAPVIATFTTFIVYYLSGGVISASNMFSVVSLLNLMASLGLSPLPASINSLIDGYHALKRLENFMLILTSTTTTKINNIVPYDSLKYGKPSLKAVHASFDHYYPSQFEVKIKNTFRTNSLVWEKENIDGFVKKSRSIRNQQHQPNSEFPNSILNDLNFSTDEGIIGVVEDRSNKNNNVSASFLLKSILGIHNLTHGQLTVDGTVGYIPSTGWVLHGFSIRDNILMGNAYDEEKYQHIIHCLNLFFTVDDEKTIVIEDGASHNGIDSNNQQLLTISAVFDATQRNSSSGGSHLQLHLVDNKKTCVKLTQIQKKKITIARVLYTNPDILLIDDIFSGIDETSSLSIFKNCFLKKKKRTNKVTTGSSDIIEENTIASTSSYSSVSSSLVPQIVVITVDQRNTKILSQCNQIIYVNTDDGTIHVHHNDTVEQQQNRPSHYMKTPLEKIRNETSIDDTDKTLNEVDTEEEKKIASSHDECKTVTSTTSSDTNDTVELDEINNDHEPSMDLLDELNSSTTFWSSYKYYLISSSWMWMTATAFSFVLGSIFYGILEWILAYWIEHNNQRKWSEELNEDPETFYMMLSMLIMVLVLCILVFLIRGLIFAKFMTSTSTSILFDYFMKLLKMKIPSFRSTKAKPFVNMFLIDGFNRFQYILDMKLPMALLTFVHYTLYGVVVVIMMVILLPWFALALIPSGLVFLYFINFFVKVTREIKSLHEIHDSDMRTHLHSFFKSIPFIKSSQRSFVQDQRSDSDTQYYQQHVKKLLMNSIQVKILHSTWISTIYFASSRWAGLRFDLLGSVLVFFAGVASVTIQNNMSSSMAGLIFSLALYFVNNLLWAVDGYTETDSYIALYQQISNFIDDIPQEGESRPLEVVSKIVDDDSNKDQYDNWPWDGSIFFDKVTTRISKIQKTSNYTKHNDAHDDIITWILHQFSLQVKGGEKIVFTEEKDVEENISDDVEVHHDDDEDGENNSDRVVDNDGDDRDDRDDIRYKTDRANVNAKIHHETGKEKEKYLDNLSVMKYIVDVLLLKVQDPRYDEDGGDNDDVEDSINFNLEVNNNDDNTIQNKIFSSGNIYIDNVNISDIELSKIRKSIISLPSNSPLYSATTPSRSQTNNDDPQSRPSTLRCYLDPDGLFVDSEVWEVLNEVEVDDYIRNHYCVNLLNTPIQPCGSNFSLVNRRKLNVASLILKAKAIQKLKTSSNTSATPIIVDDQLHNNPYKLNKILIIESEVHHLSEEKKLIESLIKYYPFSTMLYFNVCNNKKNQGILDLFDRVIYLDKGRVKREHSPRKYKFND
eukprot:TRINITY_DN6602_c0_g1_i1.p1 TRINITY_DN6602_c0_g1~~TRINITY_DN6602_c0_g1_i1.p1  ORF type:complete len:1328 (+),score=305.27 TRINITY_DN6602_c0_g1_i1:629-4612(+)